MNSKGIEIIENVLKKVFSGTWFAQVAIISTLCIVVIMATWAFYFSDLEITEAMYLCVFSLFGYVVKDITKSYQDKSNEKKKEQAPAGNNINHNID